MHNTINLIFDISILICILMGIVSSIIILYLIYRHQHRTPINSPILLLCNTYFAFLAACFPFLEMYIFDLYGNMTKISSLETLWCYIRAYLLHVGLCSVYHFYMLRLFRTIFYKYKRLQNYVVIFRLIIIQWFIDFCLILSLILRNDFQYLFNYYYCQISFENLHGLALSASFIYYIPMGIIGTMYFSIIYYMRENRRRQHEKDIAVFRRILILIGMLLILSLPSILLWIVYKITGYLYSFIYHLQWISVAFSLGILPLISAMLTPYLRGLITSIFKRNTRVQAIIINQNRLVFPLRLNS